MPQPLYLIAGALSWPLVGLPFRLRARGVENVPAGGLVLASNHLSNLDPWPLGLPLWPRRQLRFMAKSELFHPLLKPILYGGGAFPVHRGAGDREAMRTAVDLVRAGEIVVMFPEGTRRTKGLRKKFEPRAHTGAARIALLAGSPLVPAALRGTDRLSRLGPMHIVYGKPIPLDDLRETDAKSAAVEATRRLMAEIAELEGTL
jgi:1-acyl-sn-glycerol-3-phosphate acyltransferase